MTGEQTGAAVECQACDDSGWWPHWCDGLHAMCGRRRAHLPHDYVVECRCRPMNRTYQERERKARRVA